MQEKVIALPALRVRYTLISSIIFTGFLVLIFLQPILLPPVDKAAGGADIRAMFVPWLQMAKNAIHEGHLPLWDPYQFGGYPFLSNPQVALFYPPTWLALFLPVRIAISWHIALHVWLMCLGMMLLLRQQHATWSGATLGAITFSFSGFVTARIFAGHIGVLATFAWLPWLLLLYERAVTQGRYRWQLGIVAGIPFGLAILAGHTASLLYVGIIWIMWAIALLIEHQSLRAVGQMILAGAVGLGLSSIQFLPYLQMALSSSRVADASFEFATGYSFPPAHLITLLMPEYFGEPTRIGYWSVPVFEEMVYYTGIVPLIALALALRRPERRTWLYLLLALVGLWIALGHYTFLYERLYDWFLPFRLSRAPARAGVLYTFGTSMLLGITYSYIRRAPHPAVQAPMLRWVLTVGVLVGVAGLAATGAVFAAEHPTETSGRLWHQLAAWGWALLMLVLACSLIWVVLDRESDRFKQQLAAAALVLLVVVDLWHFGHKFVRLEPVAPASIWQVMHNAAGDSQERVLPWGVSIFEQNGAAQTGLYSIFGYNPLAPAANEMLTSSVADPRSTAYDLFNVGFVVSGVPLDNFTGGDRPLTLVTNTENAWVYRRARVLPVVRLVYNVEVIADQERAVARIHEADFNPESTVILSQSPPCTVGPAPEGAGTTRLETRTNDSWQIRTETSAPAVLVLSETAFPGWQVTVDGQPAQPLTAYTALRAVCVPAGEHVVRWQFQPTILWWGAAISLLSLLLCLAATFSYLRYRKKVASFSR